MNTETMDRITRIRRRYLDEKPYISVERAKYFTQSWTRTKGEPQCVRVALAMKNVYEHMGMHIDPDDNIAGSWTEFFLGVPVDIEKGMFNRVLATELRADTLLGYQVTSSAKFLAYLVRQNGIGGFIDNARMLGDFDINLPSPGLITMDRRKFNPYGIKKKDRELLINKLLPYWDGKTIADHMEKRLRRAKVYPGDMAQLAEELPNPMRLEKMVSIGASVAVWQGHLVMDHETPIRKGLLEMKREVADLLAGGEFESQEQRDFLRSVEISLDGIIVYAKRLAGFVEREMERTMDPARKEQLALMLDSCRRVPMHPAESFRDAVQSYWTLKTAVELAVPFNVHAPGRMDQYLLPYYRKDIESGAITEPEAKEIIEELFLKIMSHNTRPHSSTTSPYAQRFEGSEPVTIGGLTPTGEDATNELSYLMLDAAADSAASLNFVVRFHENSPDELYLKVADIYHRGVSSVSMMNDTLGVKALKQRGFTDEDALDYAITGCVDMVAPGKTGGESFSAMLMCRVLDMTLRNGDSRTVMGMLKNVGAKTGDPDSFETFDEFFEAYTKQARFALDKIVEATDIRDRIYSELLPAPYISAFMHDCVETATDITDGGARYDFEGILFMTSIANTVDSLYVIKKLIFDEKKITFRDLVKAIDTNYKDNPDILRMTLDIDGRWGNGNPESDEIAARLTKILFEQTRDYTTFRGGQVAPFINSMTAHTIDGHMSLATPDGRLAGKPFAPSCSPANAEKNGVTGFLRSVAAIDFSEVLGCAVNIKLHPTAIGETEDARRKWIALVKTYFQMGGEQLQPNVVSSEVLRAAQADPENYRDVIVKVGGYSAYFTDLGYEIQNEIISRTEHNM